MGLQRVRDFPSFPSRKLTRTSPSLVCFQVLGVESRMKRHLLNRANLQKESHRLGPQGPFCPLKRPSPVRYVSQSWETFCIWLKRKEQIGHRKPTHVGHVGKNSIFLQTFSSTRSNTLERNPFSMMWWDPHFWKAGQSMQHGISLPTWRLWMTSRPTW